MTIRVGINGFGRIGRAYVRSVLDDDDIEVVAVNDLVDAATMSRLLRFDSTFGPLRAPVEDAKDVLIAGDKKMMVYSEREPSIVPWGELGVDVVIESTGKFRTRAAAAAHLHAGAKRVVISAPAKDVDVTIVMGVNDADFDPGSHFVISNASCTTNCVAPMVKVLDDAFGFDHGAMTTVHAYTNDQNILDGPHKDARRARSAAVNIIPTTTGAARAVGEVIPAVRGRLDGVALRVPVVDGSLVDLAAIVEWDVTASKVNEAFATAAASGPLAGRLRYCTDPIVSTDVIGDPASCVFDSVLTQVSGPLIKVFGWYDNEWGYTARLVDLTRLVGGKCS
jgi:glyceraldehyde 3-phosphate dehydrogenase (phosphorylating)